MLDDAREYILVGPVASYERHGFGLYLTVLREGRCRWDVWTTETRKRLLMWILVLFLPRFWSKGYALESAFAVKAHGRIPWG